MKQQQKFLLLAVWLIALPLQLWAQDKKPFFNLKPGDWFVYQVDINSGIQFPPHPPQTDAFISLSGNQFKHQYFLKFEYNKQLANKNQQFKITLERVKYKLRASPNGMWLGHDSFYPDFAQARSQNEQKFTYTLDITPDGNIYTLLPQALDYIIPLQEISPKKTLGSYAYMTVTPLPMEFLKLITDFITLPHVANESRTITNLGDADLIGDSTLTLKVTSVAETSINLLAKVALGDQQLIVPFHKENLLPGMINLQGLSILLTKASFPIPANAVVKGKILKADVSNNATVSTYNQEFKLNPDGSFYCPVFLTHTGQGYFSYGKFTMETFMSPGDTLEIVVDAEDSGSLKLAGSAATNTEMVNAMNPLFRNQDPNAGILLKSRDTESFIRNQERDRKAFNKVIAAYAERASAKALDYMKTEWEFLLAEAKLYFLYSNNYRYSPNSAMALQGFPQDFFLQLDTLPVAMNDFVGGLHYNNYFEWYLPFMQARVGMSSGGQFGFLSSYSIALASLKQYPLYMVLADELEEEIEKNTWTQNQRVKPYYEDFIANCRDTFFTKPLVKLWQRNERWAPGNALPVKTLTLADGSALDLTKFKGKALCLIINNHHAKELEGLLKQLGSYNPEEVHFVIAQINRPNFKAEPLNTVFQKLPNVTYVEMSSDNSQLEKFGTGMFETNVFLFDKWQRIIENNIQLHKGSEQMLDEPIKKAIDAKRYSDKQKAELMQIGGWSLGSILFVVVVGLFLYRSRLRTIRQQELVKRQMQELEIKAIRSQMNPHFIFNALNSIQSLINGSQFREANIYLAKFSTLLRSVLNNSEKSMVPLSDELQAVKLYCQLEQLRFDFAFELVVDEAINPNLIEVPPMIIQPLVENAIVHGLAPKGNEGELQIHISLVQGQLQVLVTDNGAGLNKAKADKLSQKGFGLKLVQERINILSHEDKKASLSLQSAPAGEAKKTTSLLTIPID